MTICGFCLVTGYPVQLSKLLSQQIWGNALHCTALHCIALYYTALYYLALHCTAQGLAQPGLYCVGELVFPWQTRKQSKKKKTIEIFWFFCCMSKGCFCDINSNYYWYFFFLSDNLNFHTFSFFLFFYRNDHTQHMKKVKIFLLWAFNI